jgi:hypothetical protein
LVPPLNQPGQKLPRRLRRKSKRKSKRKHSQARDYLNFKTRFLTGFFYAGLRRPSARVI